MVHLEAVVQRQQCVLAEGDDDRLIFDAQHRRMRIFGTGRQILDRRPLLPLCNRLLVDAVAFRQRPRALLTLLYRSTDRLRRRDAPVEYLSHSASSHSFVNNAPSKPGIKHLVGSALGAAGPNGLSGIVAQMPYADPGGR